MEFEAALFKDPTNEEAVLELAECLRVRGDSLKGPSATAAYRRALVLAEGVARESSRPNNLAKAWEEIGGAQDVLGDHEASRRSYLRLLAFQTNGISRLRARSLIADQDEKLGRWQSAADGYRFLAKVDGEPGWYADKVREMEEKRAAKKP